MSDLTNSLFGRAFVTVLTAASMLVGCEPPDAPEATPEDPPEATERAPTSASSGDTASHRRLSVGGSISAPGWALLRVDSETTCPSTRLVAEAFDDLESELGDQVVFLRRDVAELFHIQHDVPFDMAQAAVLLLKDGTIVDAHSGAISGGSEDAHSLTMNSIKHLLARNGVNDTDPDELLLQGYLAPGTRENRPIGPIDLSGQDFSGDAFRRSFLSGTRLRDANLEGADFTEVTFAGADLKGAAVNGAVFEGSFWLNSRCPDGTMSDENKCQYPNR